MNCTEFLNDLDSFLKEVRKSDGAFEQNLRDKDWTFCEWVIAWIAWHELATSEDCKRQYWQDGYD